MVSSNTTIKMIRILGILSFIIPIIIALIIISFLLHILPNSMQELPMLLPFYMCPIGIALGGISFIFAKSRLAGWGIVLNCLFSFAPLLLMMQ